MLLNLSEIFQTSVPLQVQLSACCSAGILHGALCHSRGFQAPSDVGAPEIAARELCLELPCELVSSSFTPPGWAEQNPNLTPLLEYHLGQTGGKAQPDFTKDPQSKALLQLAARTPHMCTELEGSENSLQNIFHFFIIPPLKKNVIPNIPFLSSEDWKSADLSLSAILNLGSSGTT